MLCYHQKDEETQQRASTATFTERKYENLSKGSKHWKCQNTENAKQQNSPQCY